MHHYIKSIISLGSVDGYSTESCAAKLPILLTGRKVTSLSIDKACKVLRHHGFVCHISSDCLQSIIGVFVS